MTRLPLIVAAAGVTYAAAILALDACSAPLTPQQQAAATLGAEVAAATVPQAAQALMLGQAVCTDGSSFVGLADAITGKPLLVTGQSAQFVQNACSAMGVAFVPTAPPNNVVALPVAAVKAPAV